MSNQYTIGENEKIRENIIARRVEYGIIKHTSILESM